MAGHPLQGWYLVRYYNEGLSPLASVMDLPERAAAKHNAEHMHYGSGATRDSPDPAARLESSLAYIKQRGKVEDWLASEAKLKGITPETARPLYLCLSKVPKPDPPLRGGLCLAIPADKIPATLLSFTLDDGFYSYQHTMGKSDLGFPPHGKIGEVLTSSELVEALKDYGPLPATQPDGRPRYIEAQLWTRRVDDFMKPAPEASGFPTAASMSGKSIRSDRILR